MVDRPSWCSVGRNLGLRILMNLAGLLCWWPAQVRPAPPRATWLRTPTSAHAHLDIYNKVCTRSRCSIIDVVAWYPSPWACQSADLVVGKARPTAGIVGNGALDAHGPSRHHGRGDPHDREARNSTAHVPRRQRLQLPTTWAAGKVVLFRIHSICYCEHGTDEQTSGGFSMLEE
jgi:hypothetical protein